MGISTYPIPSTLTELKAADSSPASMIIPTHQEEDLFHSA